MAKKQNLPFHGVNSESVSVTLAEENVGYLTQLAGWDNFEAAANIALKAHSLGFPGDYRMSVRHESATVWRVAPDRVLIRSTTKPVIQSSANLAVLDLSDGRVCLTLEGAGAAGLLSRVIALDFSEAAFPVSAFAQTAFQHIGVLVQREGSDRFIVMIPTTWARSLTDLMVTHLVAAA